MQKRISHKSFLSRSFTVKRRLAAFVLPWIADVLTKLRYTNLRSKFLDRLIFLSES